MIYDSTVANKFNPYNSSRKGSSLQEVWFDLEYKVKNDKVIN